MIWRGAAQALLGLCLASCRDSGFVAELITKEASVERDFSRAPEAWSSADIGARFEMGDGVRTGKQAQATLALPRRARLLVKSDTVVRFKRSLDPAAPGDQIEMQQGEVTIETGELALGVTTPRGVVKLTAGSSIRMRADPQGTHFDVMIGRVEYSVDGAARSVEAGGGFDLDVRGASVEREPVAAAEGTAPSKAAPSDAAKTVEQKPAADERRRAVVETAFQEPPPGALVTLAAGESATIHDPAPPSDVRLTFSQCPEPAVLELDRVNGGAPALRVRGSGGEVRARIPAGSFKYRLRCANEAKRPASSRSGRLTVVDDAATRPLPVAPVTITADADGRRYTVSYQNRLPQITLRWPDAPRADSYRLIVRPERGEPLSLESGRSSFTLESGRVAEGLHEFWFETRDKKRSERGKLQVSFDYAARTAYLTSPREGEPAAAGHTRVAGGTLLGSSVHAQGAPLKLDAQGRFASNVALPAGAAGTYVRVQHRSTGIHYYVRHLRRAN